MEVLSFLAQFVYFLIPGILGMVIYYHLSNQQPKTDVLMLSYSFVMSAICYIIGNVIIGGINLTGLFYLEKVEITQLMSDAGNIPMPSFVVAFLCAIVFSMLLLVVNEKSLLFRIAKTFKISMRENNKDIWEDLFDENIFVKFQDHITGNTYHGVVLQYSEKNTVREIFLQDVEVLARDGNKLYELEKFYCARNYNEFSIEIIEYKEVEEDEKKRK